MTRYGMIGAFGSVQCMRGVLATAQRRDEFREPLGLPRRFAMSEAHHGRLQRGELPGRRAVGCLIERRKSEWLAESTPQVTGLR